MRTSWDIAVASCAILLLSGCSGVLVASTIQTSSVQGVTLQGRVHGGQQPIQQASVYLYAAGVSGYGGASVPLLKNPVTTDQGGNFTITNDYSCTPGQQVYLYAVGGNPGAGTNSAAGLLAAIGACPAAGVFSNSMFIFMNEVSTVATAYALAGYATDATDRRVRRRGGAGGDAHGRQSPQPLWRPRCQHALKLEISIRCR
jgi:hypothetical protein